jgi:hypothetical protein
MIVDIWGSIRRPTREEIRWVELFRGKKDTNQIRNRAYIKRKTKHGKKPKEFLEWLEWWKFAVKDSEKYVNEKVLEIKKKHAKTIEKYGFPSYEILELVYPNFLKDTFQITRNNR